MDPKPVTSLSDYAAFADAPTFRLPPSPLRETSAETLYIFQLYALMKEKRRPGKDGKISIKCMMG